MGYIRNIVRNITSLWIVFVFRLNIYNVTAIPDMLLDYCLKDVFAAECPLGYVVLVEEARYGRMELGTCLRIDIGFMGCSSDATSIMDQWCSGQQACQFKVRNLMDFINPCPEEVTTYLQARYTCLKVTTPENNCCHTTKSNILNEATYGVLASGIAVLTGCGYSTCPWIIQAPMGQLLNISLYDFGTYDAGLLSDGKSDDDYDNQCHLAYAVISEMSLEGSINICAGNARLKTVYLSVSNTVQIQFLDNQQNEQNQANFLIGFEAMGCPDPDPPFNMYVKRDGPRAMIECFLNGKALMIECQANKWQGDLSSCYYPSSTTSPEKRDIASFITGDVFIVFVAAVTFVISVAMVTTGIVCYQRNRSRRIVTRRSTNANAMWTMNTLDGAYAARDIEYSGTDLPRHYHRENYIYYLNKQALQDKKRGTGTERENDNGYYSDHTYESPVCEHIHLKHHSGSGNQCDSNQFRPESSTSVGRCVPTETLCGTMQGDDVLFPRSKKQCFEEDIDGNKTV